MASKSRWANTEDDARLEAQRKREKEEKKRAKAEKQREAERAAAAAAAIRQEQTIDDSKLQNGYTDDAHGPPLKRRRAEDGAPSPVHASQPIRLQRFEGDGWRPSRSVEEFEMMNEIAEGGYGAVTRVKEKATGRIAAVKRLKYDHKDAGIPGSGMREIQLLRDCNHEHIIKLQEVCVNDSKASLGRVFLVLDFMEHDLRTLLDELQICWSRAQVKMIMHQLCSGMQYLHDRWIIHRDLKSSNLLLNNRGSLKIADFGMARYMSTTKDMTGLVVTLWYRAPEILLGEKRYGPSLDMWSIGCIFGELHKLRPIFRPRNEVDALAKIFSRCGMPTKESWPGFRKLPNARDIPSLATARFSSTIPAEFGTILPGVGVKLLTRLLSLNPDSRPSAQEVLNDDYFKESPRPEKPSLFPTYPSKAGNEKKRRFETPHAPVKGDKAPEAADFANLDVGGIFAGREKEEKGAGFNLRLV